MHIKILEHVLFVLRKLHRTSVQAWTKHAEVQCQICLYHIIPGHALD